MTNETKPGQNFSPFHLHSTTINPHRSRVVTFIAFSNNAEKTMLVGEEGWPGLPNYLQVKSRPITSILDNIVDKTCLIIVFVTFNQYTDENIVVFCVKIYHNLVVWQP